MSNSLLSGGNHYDLLINWDKRLSNEIPFLTSFFSDLVPAQCSILSVGCGTGRHLAELTRILGCTLIGTDLEPTMIEEAKKRSPDAKFLVGDFLDPDLLQKRKFDAIYSLGNSIGLIASTSSAFEPVIKKLSSHLKLGGTLVFQILNTMKERNGWSPPRTIRTSEGEYVFLRGFTTSDEFVHPEILTLFRSSDESEFQLCTTGRANIPRISVQKMRQLLEKEDFTDIKVFGTYQRDPFEKGSSPDMIFVCQINK
ncbi:MAG: class I SAM-dependent methyltransferase [Candidatus Hodarchaeales archaeon]|jgi:SAM-dependent methyltransferase